MGENLDRVKQEFSLDPVNTGRIATPPFLPGQIPGLPGQGSAPINAGGINVPNPQPGMPITRPSFLQAFLANLGPALAGGLSQTSDPRFPFGTGLPGALQGVQQQNQRNREFGLQQQQMNLQQQAAQRQAQSAASTEAYQAAETQRLQQLTPLDVKEKQLNASLLQAQIGFYSNPGNLDSVVSDATKGLGKLDSAEQAQLDAAKQDAKLKRSFDPISNAVKTIAQDRFQESKADQTSGYADYKNDPTIDRGVKNKNRATFLQWKAKQQPMAVISGNMLPAGNALDQQAELYSQTHEMPPALTRSPGTVAAIIQRAAQLHPEANLAGNQAQYTADKESLKSLQRNFDQVTAFEHTAIKNLDQVSQAMAKVPELNTRFANLPVRAVNEKVLGTPEMSRLRAALLTASKESAKVLQSANASGVLSDEASREAQQVLDGALPGPAMQAAIDQLKTDFGNRHQSYQLQINDIQRRISKGVSTKNRVIDLTQ